MSDAEDSSIETRHRRERKELQSQIQQLKKSATKGEKKKRKEVNEQIAEMERALEERHARELVEQDAVDSVAEKIATKLALEESETTYDVASNDNDAVLTKKLNKQQARKLRKQQEMEAMRLEAEERVRNRPDPKAIEREEMHELLQQHKLCIHEIIPDGHCLYNAIAHQLNVCKRRDDTTETHDYKELRRIAGDYMLANGEQFMPFLTDQTGMDMIGQQDYEQYCHNVSNSAEWGGQLEIQALVEALKIPIFIYQAGSPVLKLGEQYVGVRPEVRLSYHRHAYGLGEHYNSLLEEGE